MNRFFDSDAIFSETAQLAHEVHSDGLGGQPP